MRFLVCGLALGGAWLAACGNSGSTSSVDAGSPDAGDQVSETCFQTTRVTAPTATDCVDLKYQAGPCQVPDDTFDIEHVYRCSDVDGGERMPAGVEGCTRKGKTVAGTTDWWCQPVVCTLQVDYGGEFSCMGDTYLCPHDATIVGQLFTYGIPAPPPPLPACTSESSNAPGDVPICCQ